MHRLQKDFNLCACAFRGQKVYVNLKSLMGRVILNTRFTSAALFALVLLLTFAQTRFILPDLTQPDAVINGDGRGYYEYLTSSLLEHDLENQKPDGRIILNVNGKGINKYFFGTSILMLPFFVLGHLFAILFDFNPDGYSLPYHAAMALAAVCYWMIGLFFLLRIFKEIGIYSPVSWLIIFGLTFGTNALYYITVDPTSSHVYSFAAISVWLFVVIRFLKSPKRSDVLLGALLLGLIVSIRPVNLLVLCFIPALYSYSDHKISAFKNFLLRPINLALLLLSFLALPFIQLFLYKIQSGSWLVWSYNNEGFYFLKPAWWSFLFSFERGWFIYSPLFLLIIAALIIPCLRVRAHITWAFGFAAVVYVLSSWWDWRYGGSFGSRPMIDFYAIFGLIIGIWLHRLSTNFQLGSAAYIAAAISLNIFQTYQLHAGIISSWNMNFEKYTWSLGKHGEIAKNQLGGRWDAQPFHKAKRLVYASQQPILQSDEHWNFTAVDQNALVFNNEIEFNGLFEYDFIQEHKEKGVFGIQIGLNRLEISPNAASSAYVVIEIENKVGDRVHYDAFKINDRPDLSLNEWQKWNYHYVLPKNIEDMRRLTCYFWNQGRDNFLVTDIELFLWLYEP